MSKVTDQLYVEYTFTLQPVAPWSDVLAAQLGEKGFESFMETDTGLLAYIQQDLDQETLLDDLELLHNEHVDIAFAKANIPATNWNHEWERNFDPIRVQDMVEVRAPFHESQGFKYDIIIEPKMSFGTGHHQTTFMMMEHLLEQDMSHKRVLDMGSGTGVLAILAQMRGAIAVDAIDIDIWCYENAIENVERNGANQIQVILGGAEQLTGKNYQVIIANINRNILMEDIPKYTQALDNGGMLLLSGFYKEDLPAIKQVCKDQSLTYVSYKEKDNWVAPLFVKK